MKKIFSLFLFLIVIFSPLCFAATPEASQVPLGIWVPKEKDSHIEIYKEGDKYFGKITWIQEKDAGKLDTNNPDDKLKAQPILNLVILKNFKEDEPSKKWNDGTVYDPHNGKTYSAKMKYNEEKDTMELRGFVGISLFGRTETWTRYNPAAAP